MIDSLKRKAKGLLSKPVLAIRGIFMSPTERRHALVGPAKLWEMKRDFQIRFLRRMGLRPGHTVLDIGCGTLRGGLPIIEFLEVGDYCGLERRAKVLEEGRRELEEAGLAAKEPQLVAVDDLTGLELGRRFDFVWAFSVLIHMSDEVVDECLVLVERHLADEGAFYANVKLGGSRKDGSWQGFPLVERPLGFYRERAVQHALTLEEIGTLRDLGHVSGDDPQDAQVMLRFSRTGGGEGVHGA